MSYPRAQEYDRSNHHPSALQLPSADALKHVRSGGEVCYCSTSGAMADLYESLTDAEKSRWSVTRDWRKQTLWFVGALRD